MSESGFTSFLTTAQILPPLGFKQPLFLLCPGHEVGLPSSCHFHRFIDMKNHCYMCSISPPLLAVDKLK
uniref:Uncharacterized protein n=1 Tax=Arion vulgaris TaxID=1028688 RepID=A0A0B7AU35_9EUPU